MRTQQKSPIPPRAQIVRDGYKKKRRKRRVSIDFHGVVDSNPVLFRAIILGLINQGYEVHILTGARAAVEKKSLAKFGIPWTHIFSIVDYHESIGTKVRWTKRGPSMLPYLWDKTKATYCQVNRIEMHLDDSFIYGRFFRTPYVQFFDQGPQKASLRNLLSKTPPRLHPFIRKDPMPKPQYVKADYRKNQRECRISFDIHGVADAFPELFGDITRGLIKQNWEVHFLTGSPMETEFKLLRKLRIPFTHFFSITDHHQAIGTKIVVDEDGPHLDSEYWDVTKALYCLEHKIRMHFDDSNIYGYFFVTPYLIFSPNNTGRCIKVHL